MKLFFLTHTIHYQIDGVLHENTIADLFIALVLNSNYQNQPICLLI